MEAVKTVDEYIEQFPEERQVILQEVRRVIKEQLPDAEEKLSYGMPAYHLKENLVYFACAKNHLGFYPTGLPIIEFADELKEYKTSKGAIQFPFNKPIPYDLIKKISLWRKQYVLKYK